MNNLLVNKNVTVKDIDKREGLYERPIFYNFFVNVISFFHGKAFYLKYSTVSMSFPNSIYPSPSTFPYW